MPARFTDTSSTATPADDERSVTNATPPAGAVFRIEDYGVSLLEWRDTHPNDDEYHGVYQDEDPEKVIGCAQFGGTRVFVLKWPQLEGEDKLRCELVKSTVVHKNWPQLSISFYASRLKFHNSDENLFYNSTHRQDDDMEDDTDDDTCDDTGDDMDDDTGDDMDDDTGDDMDDDTGDDMDDDTGDDIEN